MLSNTLLKKCNSSQRLYSTYQDPQSFFSQTMKFQYLADRNYLEPTPSNICKTPLVSSLPLNAIVPLRTTYRPINAHFQTAVDKGTSQACRRSLGTIPPIQLFPCSTTHPSMNYQTHDQLAVGQKGATSSVPLTPNLISPQQPYQTNQNKNGYSLSIHTFSSSLPTIPLPSAHCLKTTTYCKRTSKLSSFTDTPSINQYMTPAVSSTVTKPATSQNLFPNANHNLVEQKPSAQYLWDPIVNKENNWFSEQSCLLKPKSVVTSKVRPLAHYTVQDKIELKNDDEINKTTAIFINKNDISLPVKKNKMQQNHFKNKDQYEKKKKLTINKEHSVSKDLVSNNKNICETSKPHLLKEKTTCEIPNRARLRPHHLLTEEYTVPLNQLPSEFPKEEKTTLQQIKDTNSNIQHGRPSELKKQPKTAEQNAFATTLDMPTQHNEFASKMLDHQPNNSNTKSKFSHIDHTKLLTSSNVSKDRIENRKRLNASHSESRDCLYEKTCEFKNSGLLYGALNLSQVSCDPVGSNSNKEMQICPRRYARETSCSDDTRRTYFTNTPGGRVQIIETEAEYSDYCVRISRRKKENFPLSLFETSKIYDEKDILEVHNEAKEKMFNGHSTDHRSTLQQKASVRYNGALQSPINYESRYLNEKRKNTLLMRQYSKAQKRNLNLELELYFVRKNFCNYMNLMQTKHQCCSIEKQQCITISSKENRSIEMQCFKEDGTELCTKPYEMSRSDSNSDTDNNKTLCGYPHLLDQKMLHYHEDTSMSKHDTPIHSADSERDVAGSIEKEEDLSLCDSYRTADEMPTNRKIQDAIILPQVL